MEYASIRFWLENYDGPKIKKYEDTVITDTHLPIIGIPMGSLRQKAKKLCRDDWRQFLQQARYDLFEEVLLLGLTLAYAKEPFSQKIPELRQLLLHLDSWAHTDGIVPTFRIQECEKKAAWDFTLECLQSRREYVVRFGIIMLMNYFRTEDKLAHTLTLLVNIWDDRYYVQMAVAWCLAEIAVENYQAVESILRSGALDTFTHNKTIQKMRESYRIPTEQKNTIKLFKRKDKFHEENYGN